MKSIIGGIFGTGKYTEFRADGEAIERKEKFNIRLYKDLWHTGAIKKLKGNKLSVWLTIAIHANNQAEGWPSQRTIAELLGLNKDTVTKALEALEKDGFIERTEAKKRKDNGKFGVTKYKIKFAPDLTSPKKSDRQKPSKNEDSNQSEKTGQVSLSEKTGHEKVGQDQSEKTGHKEELSFKNDPSFKNDFDDDAARIPEKWESDSLYIAFREVFTKAGASDIKKHDEHYQKFLGAVDKIGFGKLIQAAEECVQKEKKAAQIVLFLSGQYNQYIHRDKPVSNKRKARATGKPVSLQQNIINRMMNKAKQETGATIDNNIDPETLADINKTMNFLRGTEKQVLANKE